jgi:phenylalanyl-tRNA synthetase beta chain
MHCFAPGLVAMAAALEWNLNHGQRNARLFEIGSQYRLSGTKSVETRVLSLGATGEAREKDLHDTARAYSFADLKGDLDSLGELAGGFEWRDRAAGAPSQHTSHDTNHVSGDWAHVARRGRVALAGEDLGDAGQLARRVADRLKLRQDVFLAELRLEPVYSAIRDLKDSRRYEPLPRFPAVERDFSLLLADGTHFSDVTQTIRSLGIREISSIEAGDLFRGKNVPTGKYSLMVRVIFQSREATLTDAQIAEFSGRIVATLKEKLGAQLRAS